MVESRWACQEAAKKEASARRAEVRRMRDEETRSISSDWKEGFARLKIDNDTRQVGVKKFVVEQMGEIDRWLAQALAG